MTGAQKRQRWASQTTQPCSLYMLSIYGNLNSQSLSPVCISVSPTKPHSGSILTFNYLKSSSLSVGIQITQHQFWTFLFLTCRLRFFVAMMGQQKVHDDLGLRVMLIQVDGVCTTLWETQPNSAFLWSPYYISQSPVFKSDSLLWCFDSSDLELQFYPETTHSLCFTQAINICLALHHLVHPYSPSAHSPAYSFSLSRYPYRDSDSFLPSELGFLLVRCLTPCSGLNIVPAKDVCASILNNCGCDLL